MRQNKAERGRTSFWFYVCCGLGMGCFCAHFRFLLNLFWPTNTGNKKYKVWKRMFECSILNRFLTYTYVYTRCVICHCYAAWEIPILRVVAQIPDIRKSNCCKSALYNFCRLLKPKPNKQSNKQSPILNGFLISTYV